MKGINEFMAKNREQIPIRVSSLDSGIDVCPSKDFMLGYKYLLVRQGDNKVKSKFQPCETIDDINYFLNMWDKEFNYHGEYAVYTMTKFESKL